MVHWRLIYEEKSPCSPIHPFYFELAETNTLCNSWTIEQIESIKFKRRNKETNWLCFLFTQSIHYLTNDNIETFTFCSSISYPQLGVVFQYELIWNEKENFSTSYHINSLDTIFLFPKWNRKLRICLKKVNLPSNLLFKCFWMLLMNVVNSISSYLPKRFSSLKVLTSGCDFNSS